MTTASRTNVLILLATFAALLAFYAVHDVIPYASGTGYDGGRYAAWAKVVSVTVVRDAIISHWRGTAPPDIGEPIDAYYAHRILPSMVVHYLLRTAGAEMATANVIAGFLLLNVVLLLVTTSCWLQSADVLGISTNGKWLGAFALIVSYGNLKMPLYYATLTDTAALATGAASVLFYLSDRTVALALTTFVGAFIWPTAAFFGALLITFRRADLCATSRPSSADTIVAAVLALATVGVTMFLLETGYEIRSTPVRPLEDARYLSVAVVGIYLFVALRRVADVRATLRAFRPTTVLARALLAAALVGSSSLMAAAIAMRPGEFGFREFMSNVLMSAVLQPFTFFLAHVLYFGPILVFLLFAWRDVSARVRALGAGAVAIMTVTAFLSIGSESRVLINVLPFVLLMLVPSVDRVIDTAPRWMAFAAITFVCSKVWLPMDRTLRVPFVGAVEWRAFYTSSHGPWIDHRVYLAQMVPLIVVGLLFRHWYRAPVTEVAPLQAI